MSSRSISVAAQRTALERPFTIARGSKTHAETVVVTLRQPSQTGYEVHTGRGECVPYARYGETVASVMEAIAAVQAAVEAGCTRDDLRALMPAGAARCAIDCALWDLEAKASGTPVWALAGLPEPKAIETAQTLSLDTPDAMARAASEIAGTLLKLKLGGADDLIRVSAVHHARPDARLIVDANEGLDPASLPGLLEAAADLGVVLIEQPLADGADGALVRGGSPVTVCADESVHTAADIPALSARYDAVNVKLDKAGGLTAAMDLVAAAKAEGMTTMVGCMVAGSLSMAPAILLAQITDFADVDGPIWLLETLDHPLVYRGGSVSPPHPALWG